MQCRSEQSNGEVFRHTLHIPKPRVTRTLPWSAVGSGSTGRPGSRCAGMGLLGAAREEDHLAAGPIRRLAYLVDDVAGRGQRGGHFVAGAEPESGA